MTSSAKPGQSAASRISLEEEGARQTIVELKQQLLSEQRSLQYTRKLVDRIEAQHTEAQYQIRWLMKDKKILLQEAYDNSGFGNAANTKDLEEKNAELSLCKAENAELKYEVAQLQEKLTEAQADTKKATLPQTGSEIDLLTFSPVRSPTKSSAKSPVPSEHDEAPPSGPALFMKLSDHGALATPIPAEGNDGIIGGPSTKYHPTDGCRMVLIYPLPKDISMRDLLSAVRGGAVTTCVLADDLHYPGCITAIITFAEAKSAMAFVQWGSPNGIMFSQEDGSHFVAAVKLASGDFDGERSHTFPRRLGPAHRASQTRCLQILSCPTQLVRQIMYGIGATHTLLRRTIEDVWYDDNGDLNIHFTDSDRAGDAFDMICGDGAYVDIRDNVFFKPDPCKMDFQAPVKPCSLGFISILDIIDEGFLELDLYLAHLDSIKEPPTNVLVSSLSYAHAVEYLAPALYEKVKLTYVAMTSPVAPASPGTTQTQVALTELAPHSCADANSSNSTAEAEEDLAVPDAPPFATGPKAWQDFARAHDPIQWNQHWLDPLDEVVDDDNEWQYQEGDSEGGRSGISRGDSMFDRI